LSNQAFARASVSTCECMIVISDVSIACY
jgi:hypothetical protein